MDRSFFQKGKLWSWLVVSKTGKLRSYQNETTRRIQLYLDLITKRQTQGCFLHAKHAADEHLRIAIQSPDTDVAILCLYAFRYLACLELWFRTGIKDKQRFIPSHTMSENLGEAMCLALPGLHALTGCDSTSAFCGVGKKKSLKLVRASSQYKMVLQNWEELTEDTFQAIEKICL